MAINCSFILLVLSREWMEMGVAGMIIDTYCGSFPHSLRLAPVSYSLITSIGQTIHTTNLPIHTPILAQIHQAKASCSAHVPSGKLTVCYGKSPSLM